MNVIERSASVITRSIKQNNPNAASEAVLMYSLTILINTTIAIVTALLISAVTGNLLYALLTIFVLFVLRYITGGVHLSSSAACCVVTIIFITAISHAHFQYYYLASILDVASILIFMKTVPNGIQGVSSIPIKYYPLLKITSVLIVSANFFIHSSVLSAAFITQAFCTTALAYKVRDHLERRWVK